MNFLAHLYLSGDNEKLMVGNFIGDYVKGRKYEDYEDGIKQGILLHRKIDTFTDGHPKFRESKRFFISEFGLYSGIVIDLVFDHILASNWQLFSNVTLHDYTKRVHNILLSNFRNLPLRVQTFIPFLIKRRRLESYATPEGIGNALKTMSRYTSLPDKSVIAVEIMKANLPELKSNFDVFMADIIGFVETQGVEIITAGNSG